MPSNDRPVRSEAAGCVGIGDAEAPPRGIWLVQVTSEDMRAMTLDELDAAFKSGVIDEHTLVLPDGTYQWDELGLVAGREPVGQPKIHAH